MMAHMPDVCNRADCLRALVCDDVEHVIFRLNRTVAVCEKRLESMWNRGQWTESN